MDDGYGGYGQGGGYADPAPAGNYGGGPGYGGGAPGYANQPAGQPAQPQARGPAPSYPPRQAPSRPAPATQAPPQPAPPAMDSLMTTSRFSVEHKKKKGSLGCLFIGGA